MMFFLNTANVTTVDGFSFGGHWDPFRCLTLKRSTGFGLKQWFYNNVALLLNGQQNKVSATFNQQMALENLTPVILEYVLISLQLQENKINLAHMYI